jgi:hypothetical protein
MPASGAPVPFAESERQLLISARREMLVAAAIWLAALIWTCGYCAKYGYNLQPEDLKFVLGFPDWIFWGVVLPWGVCTLISGWFAFFFMQDADLGDTDDAPQSTETE